MLQVGYFLPDPAEVSPVVTAGVGFVRPEVVVRVSVVKTVGNDEIDYVFLRNGGYIDTPLRDSRINISI